MPSPSGAHDDRAAQACLKASRLITSLFEGERRSANEPSEEVGRVGERARLSRREGRGVAAWTDRLLGLAYQRPALRSRP
jgi:hypothetical protein